MAAPIKGTKGPNTLSGTDGADKLMGKDGDDFITGGKGNDDIDGGKGIDTAVYSGSYAQYSINFGGHLNGHGADDSKLTVSDSVAGRDGVDTLRNVEFLKFNDALVDVRNNDVYFADALLDNSAQKPGTDDMINGSGIPADHFGIVQDLGAGIELGLKVHDRFGPNPTILHSDANGYADGVLEFQVDAGAGNPPTNTRATWNFDFSIATGLNGATTGLSDFHFKLLVDVDKGAGTDFHVWELGAGGVGSANTHWNDTSAPLSPIIIGDDGGIANKVTQNSENFGFGFIRNFIDDDSGTPGIQPYNFGPGEFDIILQAFDNSNTLIAQNHIQVDVVV